MKTSQVVYQRKKPSVLGRSGQVLLSLFAYVCISFSVVSLLFLLSPWLYGQANALWRQFDVNVLSADEQIDYTQPSFSNIMHEVEQEKKVEEPVVEEVDKSTLPFEIRIPDIGVDSKVFSNIDASNPAEYESVLKEGVAHAYGSVFPGDDGMIYIFGHSTDYAWNVETYNALFYEVKDLQPGADVFLELGDDIFEYRVKEQHVIQPGDLSFLQQFADQNVLLLQTCYPPGTTWQRLIVVAEPVVL